MRLQLMSSVHELSDQNQKLQEQLKQVVFQLNFWHNRELTVSCRYLPSFWPSANEPLLILDTEMQREASKDRFAALRKL